VLGALASIPKLKKLNLSRNRFTEWQTSAIFENLIELYLAFNGFLEENAVIPALESCEHLQMLVVTGNIFALDNNQTYKLIAKLCDRPNGQLINELTEPPEYMKGSRTLKETMPFNNMLNYGASKGLV